MSERQHIGWRVKRDGVYFVSVGPGMVQWGNRKEGMLFIVSHLADKIADMTGGKVKSVFKRAQ